MKIGVWELMVVFVVALLVIGPDKLPEYAKKLGEALGQFKKYSSEATREIRESVVEPLQEAQRPLKEAMEPFNEIEKSVKGEMDDLKKSFSDIGKMPPKEDKEKTPAEAETADEKLPAEEAQAGEDKPAPEEEQAADSADAPQSGQA